MGRTNGESKEDTEVVNKVPEQELNVLEEDVTVVVGEPDKVQDNAIDKVEAKKVEGKSVESASAVIEEIIDVKKVEPIATVLEPRQTQKLLVPMVITPEMLSQSKVLRASSKAKVIAETESAAPPPAAESTKLLSNVSPALIKFQQRRLLGLAALAPTPTPAPTSLQFIRGHGALPTTDGSPRVYSLRPVIPAHLANKTVADPSIQIELEYLRSTSAAARGRGVMEQARMFGGAVNVASGGAKKNASGDEKKKQGAAAGTPVLGNAIEQENDDAGQENTTSTNVQSLRALAIAHRMKTAKASALANA